MSEAEKALVGAHAAEFVADGAMLGLGTGSTVRHFARALGARIASGLSVTAVPTSAQSRELADEFGITLGDWPADGVLDLCVDGADEIDAGFDMIKGGGGALLHEKIVAGASRRRIYIADSSKLVPQLGRFPLPVEVNRFGLPATLREIRALCSDAALRRTGRKPFQSTDGNLIVDAPFGRIADPAALHRELLAIPGVIETGLFLGLVDELICVRDGAVALVHPGDGVWWGNAGT